MPSRAARSALLSVALLIALVIGFAVYAQQTKDDGATDAVGGPPASPSVPPAPPGTPTTGMLVRTRVLGNERIRVEHWIRADEPVRVLSMKATDPDDLPGTVEARNVAIISDDGQVLGRRSSIGTRTQQVSLKTPTSDFYVSYTLFGGIDDKSSVAGRVLARVTSLDVDFPQESGKVRRTVDGAGTVLSLACLFGPGGRNVRPCGQQAADGQWGVDLAGEQRSDRLMALFELS